METKGSKVNINDHLDYWEILSENLCILSDIQGKLEGYSYTSNGEDIQRVNELILDLAGLAKEMVDELVEVGEDE